MDNFADLIVSKDTGEACWMLKQDLSWAYRQLRLDPSDYHLLGFKWKKNFDIALQFVLCAQQPKPVKELLMLCLISLVKKE